MTTKRKEPAVRGKNVATLRIFCVCGKRLELELRPPDGYHTVWHRYCLTCKRHIRLLVSHNG